MTSDRPLWAGLVLVASTGCNSGLQIVHEEALIGQYRDARLGDDAADIHARYAEIGGKVDSTVIRQDISDRQVLDQLSMAAGAEFRDVTEANDIRVLFIEREADAPEAGAIVLATTTSANEVFHSEGYPLYDAVLTGNGIALAMRDSSNACLLRWLNWSGEVYQQVELELSACTDSLQLTSGRPGTSIGYTNDTYTGVANEDGAKQWEGGGNLIAWDGLTNAVVVATANEPEVRAWLDDGTESWYTDIGQSIQDLDAMGASGALALATTVGSNGRIVLLDSVSGIAVAATDVPIPGQEISAGSAGTHLALTLDDELHIFSVDLAGAQ